MILLWGLPGDTPLAAVHETLQRKGATVTFLKQWDFLNTALQLQVGTHMEGTLRIREEDIDLGDISAVYLRPYNLHELPMLTSVGQGSEQWLYALQVEDILASWIELTPALVVNRPEHMATNNSKPYQAALIRASGFATPESLITTDPEAVLEFWQHHGTIIYKSISDIRSIVSRLTSAQEQRLAKVKWCPTLFQQYIPGYDYRVHIVGEKVFACRIRSTADDYRYAGQWGASTQLESCHLSPDIEQRCYTLATSLKLTVAGIDLRATPDGDWYCFEVNPSPGFTYYQHATNQPIDEAIADLLIAGH